jgi:hypothetical protein
LNNRQIRANTPALSPAEARIEREAREERERVKATESGTYSRRIRRGYFTHSAVLLFVAYTLHFR